MAKDKILTSLTDLAALFWAGKVSAHAAHHMTKGPSFFSDHEFLGELYQAYDAAFDVLMERAIGLGWDDSDYAGIIEEGYNQSSDYGFTDAPFTNLRRFEQEVQDTIRLALQLDPSQGVQNLLQGLADESEARLYKINQRLK